MRHDMESLKAKLESMPKTEDDSNPGSAGAVGQQLAALEHPLAETYRQYLAKEIGTLERRGGAGSNRVAAGGAKMRRVLGEGTARLPAANQEGGLLGVRRSEDGRP